MVYLYSRVGKFLNEYDSIETCSRLTGYGKSKLQDCLDSPGLIIGSCFISPYKWKNDKTSHALYFANTVIGIDQKMLAKIFKIMSKE